MNKRSIVLAATFLLVGMWAFAPAPGFALETPISPTCCGDLSLEGAGGILTILYGAGNYTRVDDNLDQIWTEFDGNVTAKAKFASFVQTFGYIAGAGPSDISGYTTLLDVTGFGFITDSMSCSTLDCSINFSTSGAFRFVLDPNDNPDERLWSSLMADNGGDDHMVTWLITAGPSTGNYVVAWEDNPLDASDRDYNDLVIEVSGVTPVPEPATLLLLGSGLFGLGLWGRRKKKLAA